MSELPALSLWEPWASCVAAGLKRVETRSWPLPRHLRHRRIAIASTKRWMRDEAEQALLVLGNWPDAFAVLEKHLGGDPWKPSSYPLGCVVATAIARPSIASANVHVTRGRWDAPRREHREVDWGPLLLGIPEVERSLGGYHGLRWATPLVEIQPVDPPCPARGKQGWWTWTPVVAS